MGINLVQYRHLFQTLPSDVTLVAVSKLKPASDILALYNEGHRDFGENYVQELTDKQAQLPKDINWHFIGHLQSNKVKYIAPFVSLIHGVDSLKLLAEVNKQAIKNKKIIPVLLQVHIAKEETKFGLDAAELEQLMDEVQRQPEMWTGIRLSGLMGMASFTEDTSQVKTEFDTLAALFEKYRSIQTDSISFRHLSMGMSNDYELAISCGSNMIRIGSMLFGVRS